MNETEAKALKEEILVSLHCAVPGKVVSFDAVSCTAVIQPMVKSRAGRSMPQLRDVPVFMPMVEGRPAFEVAPGDFCLVVFADTAIDHWMTTGEEGVPVSDRKHDLSDGFAFVGFHPGGGE